MNDEPNTTTQVTAGTPSSTPQTPASTPQTDPAAAYAAELARLRENSVPKKQYEDLSKQNQTLVAALADRTFLAPQEGSTEPPPVDLDKLRERIFKGKQRNLHYWQDVLALDAELAKRTPGFDMLAGSGASNGEPSAAARENAAHVRKVITECIALSEGNPDVFDAHLQSRLVQPAIVRR